MIHPWLTRDDPGGVPPPAGSYSHVTRLDLGTGVLLAISGQLAVGDDGRLIGTGSMTAQTERVFTLLTALLTAHGAGFADVINIRSYLTDMSRLDEYAVVRRRYLAGAWPSSTTVEVSRLVVAGALIEEELLAALPRS